MVRILLMQSNQKLRKSKRAIDEVARAKKEAIDRIQDATTEEKAAKAKVDQAVTEAKGHINEAINNSGVDEAKKWYNYNQCNPTRSNQKSEARQAIDDAARAKKKRLIKHRVQQQKKKRQPKRR